MDHVTVDERGEHMLLVVSWGGAVAFVAEASIMGGACVDSNRTSGADAEDRSVFDILCGAFNE